MIIRIGIVIPMIIAMRKCINGTTPMMTGTLQDLIILARAVNGIGMQLQPCNSTEKLCTIPLICIVILTLELKA